MPKRCGCGDTCACVINPGPGIDIDGSGTVDHPYVITNAADSLSEQLILDNSGNVDFVTVGDGTADSPLRVTANAALKLIDLTDVADTPAPTNGQTLVWNGTAWVPGAASGGGTVAKMQDLTDVIDTPPSVSGQVPMWNGTQYVPTVVPSPTPAVHGGWTLVNTAQSLTTAVVTTIAFDTVQTTPVGGITISGTGVITVPVAGTYQVNAGIAFTANATGARYGYIYQNGAFKARVAIDAVEALPSGTLSRVLTCAAGDTIEVRAYQASGANLTLLNSNFSCWADVVLVDVPAGSGIAGIATSGGLVGDGSTAIPIKLDDTGWLDVMVSPGFAIQGTERPQVRRVGQTVFSRGGWNSTGITASASFNIGTLPAGFSPTQNVLWQAGVQAGGISAQMFIGSNGVVSIRVGTTVPSYMMMGVTWLTT